MTAVSVATHRARPELPDRDLLDSPALHHRLPGLRAALDGHAMGPRLQALLVAPTHAVIDCVPGKVHYRGSDGCDLRYAVRLRNRASGALVGATVLGRILPGPDQVEVHRRTRIDPLVSAVRHRLGPFAAAAAVATDLGLVLHVFPVDPALPTLAAATDPRRVVRELLPTFGGAQSCTVEVVRHARDGRCVLRYTLGDARCLYGKVQSDGTGADQLTLLAALHPAVARDLRVPRPLRYASAIRTLICEAVPGRPADLADPGEQVSGVVAAARAAAALHAVPPVASATRSFAADLAAVHVDLDVVLPLWPDIAARLAAVLTGLRDTADRAPVQAPVFSHGDFTPSQLLIDHLGGCGVVDFDAAATAEPALDLGRFRCYLRLALARSGISADPRLADVFLAAYADAAGHGCPDASGLAARVRVYERLSLVRVAARACLQLKSRRLRTALVLLSEEVPRA